MNTSSIKHNLQILLPKVVSYFAYFAIAVDISHVSALQSACTKSLAGSALRWRFIGTARANRCCR